MNILPYKRVTNGKTYECFCVYCNGKRKTFKTKTEAQSFIKNAAYAKEEGGRKAVEAYAEYGTAIVSAIETLKAANLNPRALEDAAREYVKRFKKTHATATLRQTAEAYYEYLTSNREVSTKRAAVQAIELFIGLAGESKIPTEIGNGDIAEAMKQIGAGRSNNTFNSILRRLKAFASWADRHDYPLTKDFFDNVERRQVAAKEPRFITIEEISRLIEEAKKFKFARGILAFLTLQFFAGLRTCEISALKPEDYHFHEEHPYIRVSRAKGASRGRRGRVVPLEPNCAVILRALYPFGYTPDFDLVTPAAITMCYKRAGINERHNIGRHSFITYHIAKYDDEQKTTTICGTSKDMAAVHYKGLATKAEADRYFRIV